MKNKLGISLVALGLVCILGAGGLTAYNQWDETRAAEAAARAAEQLVLQLKALQEDTQDFQVDQVEQNIELDGEFYIGILEIPDLQLQLPVNSSMTEANLTISPCRYFGELGNELVIGAHNYHSHFGSIDQLPIGTQIYFIDVEGNQTDFTVAVISTMEATQVEAVVSSGYDLTLFTCNYSGNDRIVVRCTQVADIQQEY